MNVSIAEWAATRLRLAYTDGPISSTQTWLAQPTVGLAYEIQETNTRYWLAGGRRIVGRKIGLTSAAVQRQLGVDQPDFGMLFADMEIANGGEAAIARLLQPRAEAEVACVLQNDLRGAELTMDDLRQAIAYVLPAIEIVDSRIRDWNITLVDTIADNASSGLYVLGTQRRDLATVDLQSCAMTLTKNQAVVSSGSGAACLGHPLRAVKWLASKMVEIGRPLLAGDIVLSGALGPMTPVLAGDVVCADVDGLGGVSVTFV
jgi:2-keto-4-pentenoate hydratase